MTEEAARYVLEFTRSESGDVYAAPAPDESRAYHVRGRAQGAPDLAKLHAPASLLAACDALAGAKAGNAAARVGRALASFVAVPCWTGVVADVARRAQRRLTALTVRTYDEDVERLPWELLTFPHDSPRHAANLRHLLIRYDATDVATASRPPALARARRRRVVFAWSGAGGKVDAAAHVRLLREAIDASRPAFDPEALPALVVVENASLRAIEEALQDAVAAGEPVAVLHLLCHGGRSNEEDETSFGLALDDADGEAALDRVSPSRLQAALAPHAGAVGLVVLAACEAGSAGPVGNELGSAARAAHLAGVRAVIAPRFLLTYEGCVAFAGAFYGSLLGGLATVEAAFLDARAALLHRGSLDWASLRLYARDADGDAHRVFDARPYRGLAPYRPEHTRLLFGRDAEVAEVLADLAALERRGAPRLLVVAGASGTGKSSLVMAGALPRWREAHRGGAHTIVRPGARPADALAALDATRAGGVGKPFLAVIDQFEEVFTHVDDPAAREAFARGLWALAREASVVVTVRIDFLGRLGELWVDDGLRLDQVACDPAHQVLVAQMNAAQRLAAVEGPAAAVGLALEPGLAPLVVRDAGAEPGTLPLMSHVLDALWQARDGDVLTRAAYEAAGGVHGALDGHAQAAFEALDAAQREAARRLLLRLVRPGADGAPDTRRRRPLDELLPATEDRDVARAALDALVGARLVVAGEGGAHEFAHEALLRAWRSLRGWIDEARAHLTALARLDGWVAEWRQSPDALLTGSRLGAAIELAARHRGDVTADAQRLVAESVAAKGQEDLRRYDAMTRASDLALVAAVRAAADDPTAQAVLLRTIARPDDAPRWADLALEALARPVAERDRDVGPHDLAVFSPDAARLLTRSSSGRVRVWRTDTTTGPAQITHDAALTCAAFSADGERVVAGWADGTASVWTSDGRCLRELRGRSHGAPVTDVAFSPDGRQVATGASNGTVRVWALDFDDDPVALQAGEGRITQVAFAPDGRSLVAVGNAQEALLWDAEDRRGVPVGSRSLEARAVAWSPDGGSLLLVGMSGRIERVRLHDLTAPPEAHDLGTPLWRAVFLPDGRRVLALPHNGRARLGAVDPAGPFVALDAPDGVVRGVAVSPAGAFVTITDDGAAHLHEPSGRAVRLGAPAVRAAAFSRNGRRVFTASQDGSVRAWPVPAVTLPAWGDPAEDIHDARPNPTALTVATERVTAHASDLPDPRLHVRHTRRAGSLALPRHHGGMTRACLSRDGACLAVDDRLWWLRGEPSSVVLAPAMPSARARGFSADGARFITTTDDGVAQVWSTRDGRELARRAVDGALFAAALSGDGAVAVTAEHNTARAWRVDDPAGSLASHTRQFDVRCVAVTDDGARAASGAQREAHVWRIHPPDVEVVLPHPDLVTHVEFSPDGTRLVTCAADGVARVWALPEGRAVLAIRPPGEFITLAHFSADGTHLATVARDGPARLWPVTTEAILARLPTFDCKLSRAQYRELVGPT